MHLDDDSPHQAESKLSSRPSSFFSSFYFFYYFGF
jgi:hypothetical protein